MATLASRWVRVQDRERSFEHLFTSEYARVVAIAHRVLGDAHEAEDVAQEVFCSYYRQHEPDEPYAAAWLHRAAAHTALNVIRGRRRRQEREKLEALQRDRLQDSAELSLDPQLAAVQAEQQRAVREALRRLSPKSASILALRYSGLSYAEVAAALGVGIGQVGTLLRRAEAALRKELNDATPH